MGPRWWMPIQRIVIRDTYFDMSGDGSVLVFGLRVLMTAPATTRRSITVTGREPDGQAEPDGRSVVGHCQLMSMDPAVSADGSVVYFRSGSD